MQRCFNIHLFNLFKGPLFGDEKVRLKNSSNAFLIYFSSLKSKALPFIKGITQQYKWLNSTDKKDCEKEMMKYFSSVLESID